MKKKNIIITLGIIAIFVIISSFILSNTIEACASGSHGESENLSSVSPSTGGNQGEAPSPSMNEEQEMAVIPLKGGQRGAELPRPLKGISEQIVNHTGYTLSFNKDHNTPNWSAWQLTRKKTEGTLGRSSKFWADEAIPRANRVDYYDYKESGYDRGHMCPAADMKWSEKAMHDCFYMSNMCPQDHSLNAGSWKTLEDACRNWARTEGTIYIICGPVWKGKKHEVIGIDHRIEVPEGFFKAVLSLRKGHEKAIAFYYVNNDRRQPMSKTFCTVDEIEKLTGMDLFYQVEDKLENRIEATANIKDWK